MANVQDVHHVQDAGTVVHDMLLKIKPQEFNRGVKLPVSDPSHYSAVVLFKNVTGRSVMIFWIDYNRLLKRYFTLHNDSGTYLCNTYIGHPWLAIDSTTGAQCLMDGQLVFSPGKNRDPQEKVLERVLITTPVPTLYERSLATIVDSINTFQALNDPDMLRDYPRRLVQDIQDAIKKKIFLSKHEYPAFPFYSWFDLGILSF